MIERILVTVSIAVAATAYPTQCLAKGQDWYPDAKDSCALFITKFNEDKNLLDRLARIKPPKDSAMAKYIADFNAHFATNASGSEMRGWPMAALMIYCGGPVVSG